LTDQIKFHLCNEKIVNVIIISNAMSTVSSIWYLYQNIITYDLTL